RRGLQGELPQMDLRGWKGVSRIPDDAPEACSLRAVFGDRGPEYRIRLAWQSRYSGNRIGPGVAYGLLGKPPLPAFESVPSVERFGGLLRAGRTNRAGQCVIRGIQDPSWFRFVLWPENAMDVAILEAVGDRTARRLLRRVARTDSPVRKLAADAATRLGVRTVMWEPSTTRPVHLTWPD